MAQLPKPERACTRTDQDFCARCDFDLVFARNLCKPCYHYWYRTGRQRPFDLIEAQWRRLRIA